MSTPTKRIMITGPTASGKTGLACKLAQRTGGEIISVDSRQCYKRIDIGTAKPDVRQMKQIPHHNISVLNLTERDSVSAFLKRAAQIQTQLTTDGKQIIYAGGSTLHLQGLIQPFDNLPGPDSVNIARLEKKSEEKGIDHLFHLLEKVDPGYASAMDGLNRQRIIRALDVWMQTAKPFSSFHSRKELIQPGDMLIFGLHWPRQQLYQIINRRVDRMIEAGLIEETRSILSDGYSPQLQSLQTVGYRDVIEYLDKRVSLDQMIKNIKTKTRRYAKRQLTWFRRWSFIKWFPADEMSMDKIADIIEEQSTVPAGSGGGVRPENSVK